MEQQKGSTSKEMIWALRWSVALRTFYRQILSLLYSSFPFGNFRPRLVRALLVYHLYIAFFWGLYNPYHPLQEPEKSTDKEDPKDFCRTKRSSPRCRD